MCATILGLDLGTSGLRGCITYAGEQVAFAKVPIQRQHPDSWQQALTQLMQQLADYLATVDHIIADATSSTVMLWHQGKPASSVKMYDAQGDARVASALTSILPENSGAHGASSTLCKALQLKANATSLNKMNIAHQIDWLNAQFLGFLPPTDWNNALKLGFDPLTLKWPTSVRALLHPLPLPEVVAPGSILGTVSPEACRHWGFRSSCQVHAGTTDSIAAFLACGAPRYGEAVTSLGSTLAVKLLSETPVFSSEYGIYSHRLPMGWLAGGASNSGGNVLKHFFSSDELAALSKQLHPEQPTGLNYYPLLTPGERFPINDANFSGKLTPAPADKKIFLQGILEGLTRIEAMSYQRLVELGATAPRRILCAGGGCINSAWQIMRARILPAPLAKCHHTQAAFGVTKLLADAVA